jgi:NAD/NADP transhydrogenase beta subunit
MAVVLSSVALDPVRIHQTRLPLPQLHLVATAALLVLMLVLTLPLASNTATLWCLCLVGLIRRRSSPRAWLLLRVGVPTMPLIVTMLEAIQRNTTPVSSPIIVRRSGRLYPP